MAISVVPSAKKKFWQHWWFWLTLLGLLVGAFLFVFSWKTGATLNQISDKDQSILDSLMGVVKVGGDDTGDKTVKVDDGRTNILLLGMRGRNVPGGGLLADTIMIISLKDDEDKVALISIPRDLYVKIPGTNQRSKINAVYAHGEERGGKGLEEMKEIAKEVTGLNIDYGVVINFVGFKQLIDAVGGVDIYLETPFYETTQFVQGKECGGEFILPKGKNTLDGEKALCYARARENTSDYDRAKRQQVILKAFKDKLISLGTLTNYKKVLALLKALGNNVRTDMSTKEMRELFDRYSKMQNPQIYQWVFENSPEGKLMVPADAPPGAGFILIPRAGWDNYSEIQQVCRDIFDLPPQSDIEPMKQYYKPAGKKTEKDKKKDKKKKKKNKGDEDKEDKEDKSAEDDEE